MIALGQCKKILNRGERKYTENEIKEIRSYLYFIGGLQIENNENKTTSNERNTILPC